MWIKNIVLDNFLAKEIEIFFFFLILAQEKEKERKIRRDLYCGHLFDCKWGSVLSFHLLY